jgi:Zn-finger protein
MEQLELFDVATHYPNETTEDFKFYGYGNKECEYYEYMYQFHDCIICYPYEPEIPLTDWSKP